MCGICGKFNLNESPVEEKLIQEMIQEMYHRGPDSQGTYINSGIGLGHCRLSIVDLSPLGHQPMFDSSGQFVIVYNGEIYNFPEIKLELQNQGIHFRSFSDTEVILESYKKWGEACLDKFHGMFAFAIWDLKKHELFLARDRFGVKPLYYFKSKDTFSFASEINVLLKDKDCPKTLRLQGIYNYLSLNYIPNAFTIYQKINKLEPGHFLKINKERIFLKKWYDLSSKLNNENLNLDFTSAREKTRSLMEKAVEKRLISDVPLGAFLSGGVDSSLIVALMARASSKPIKTFTIGYKDQKLYDETSYAKIISEKFQTDHKAFLLSHDDILKIIPNLLDSLGEPFGDPSLLPSFLLAHYTRQHVTVALSGDAGDEVFAGYQKYSGEFFSKYYLKLPHFFRSNFLPSLINSLPSSRTSFLTNNIRKIKKFLYGISKEQSQRHYLWMEIFNPEIKNDMLQAYEKTFFEDPIEIVEKIQSQWPNQDSINKMLFTDLSCCLPNNMFFKVDTASMLNSLEVRSPFIDHELVEFIFSLPGKYKLRPTKQKHILLKAFSDIIPREIRNRSKHGFDVPIGEWFRKELRPLFQDIVFDNNQNFLNTNVIKKIYKDHMDRRQDNTFRLWNIFVLKWWLNKRAKSI